MIAVDLDKVLLEVCKGCNEEFSEEPCEPGCCRIRERLEKLPRVTLDDLRPKGRWIERYGVSEYKYECSLCHLGSDLMTDFCNHCGADMRGYMSDGQRNQEG